MVLYVHERLQRWAAWSAMRLEGSARFAVGFKYKEWVPQATAVGSISPDLDEQALQTEMGVSWLRQTNRRCGAVICTHYRDRPDWSAAMQATLLHVCVRTLYRDIDKAHTLLLGYFVDADAGVVPQVRDLSVVRSREDSDG
jgi:hypothetical protein